MEKTNKTIVINPYISKPIEVWWVCPVCANKNFQNMKTSEKTVSCSDCGQWTRLELK